MGRRVAQEYVMHLISATSSQLLYAVVNSAYLSERDYDEMHQQLQPRNRGRLVDLSETLKVLACALFPIAALGD
jgi:hypothetical protein